MLRTLIRKNNAESIGAKFPFVLAGAALFSVADLIFKFPPMVWGWPLGLFVIVSPFWGLDGFSGDVKKDWNQFLDYLPIRRSSRWTANYLDGLLSPFLLVSVSFWHKVVFFKPFDPVEQEFLAYLIPSGWALLAWSATIFFFLNSVGVYFASHLGQKKIIVIFVVLLVLFGSLNLMAAIEHASIIPTFLELVPGLILCGLCLVLGSFFNFALVPKHMTKPKSFLLFSIPIFLLILAGAVGWLYLMAPDWSKVRLDEPFSIMGVRSIQPQDRPHELVVTVDSPRSSIIPTVFRTNLEAQITHRLIRSRMCFGPRPSVATHGERLLLWTDRAANGVFPDDNSLVSVSPDGADIREIVRIEAHATYSPPNTFRSSSDSRFIVFAESTAVPEELRYDQRLVAMDSDGKVLKKMDVARVSGPEDYYLTDDNRVLVLSAAVDEEEDKEPEDRLDIEPYIMLDLDTLTSRTFDLPGTPLAFSTDLSRVACDKSWIEGRFQHNAVVLVDLDSMQEHTIIGEEDLPKREITWAVSASGKHWYYHGIPELREVHDASDPFHGFFPDLLFSDLLDKAVGIKRDIEEDHFVHSILFIDCDTGKKQVLVPSTELPRFPVISEGLSESNDSLISIHGFTPSCDALVYRVGGRILSQPLAGGAPLLLADVTDRPSSDRSEKSYKDRNEVLANTQEHFSPDMRSLLAQHEIRKRPGPEKATKYDLENIYYWPVTSAHLEVYEAGERIEIYSSPNTIRRAFWLDNDRVVIVKRSEILLCNRDGSGLRRVFPTFGDLAESRTVAKAVD